MSQKKTCFSIMLRDLGYGIVSIFNRCPILSFLHSRYPTLYLLSSISIYTCSTILSPYPSRPTIFLGLFVRSLIFLTPKVNKNLCTDAVISQIRLKSQFFICFNRVKTVDPGVHMLLIYSQGRSLSPPGGYKAILRILPFQSFSWPYAVVLHSRIGVNRKYLLSDIPNEPEQAQAY